MSGRLLVLFIVLVLAVAAPPAARAASYSFERITENAGTDVSGQFTATITEEETSGTRFTFSNRGDIPSSISEIYFDYERTDIDFNDATIEDGSGVNFAEGARPKQLPSGNTYGFEPNAAEASYDAKGPPHHGIDPNGNGESLSLVFGDQDFTTVKNALNDGSLLLGFHVRNIGESGAASDSFMNRVSAVPEPSEYAMMAAGVLALAGYGWSRYGRNRVAGEAEE